MARADGCYHVLRMDTMQFPAFGMLPHKFEMGQSKLLEFSYAYERKGAKFLRLGESQEVIF